MKEDNFLQAHSTLVPAGIIMLIYFFIGLFKKKITQDSFSDIIATFVSAVTLITAIRLCFYIVSKNKYLADPFDIEESENTYALIGGLALIWIGTWELIKRFKGLFK